MGFPPSPPPISSVVNSSDSIILPSTAVVNPINGLENFPPLISSSYSKNRSGSLKSREVLHLDQGISEIIAPEVVTIINGRSREVPPIEVIGDSSKNLNPNPKAWRSLFPMPKPVTPQSSMKFTPPVDVNGKLVVAAKSDRFAEGIKSCEDRVVGFFVGKRLSFTAVQLAVKNLWKFKKKVTIKLYGDCEYIFEFSDEDDRKLVLETGSFYIGKHLLILRPWSLLLEKSVTDIKSVPIWVLIHGVPLHLWNNDGLSLISSYLGIPILADDCTINQTRLAYAKICVEIDIDFSYPDSIPLLVDEKFAMDLPVEYQWKPPKCVICNVFGHSEVNCSRKLKSKWVPKKKNGISQFRTVAGVLDEGIDANFVKAVSVIGASNMDTNASSSKGSMEVAGIGAVGAPGAVIKKAGGQLVVNGKANVLINSPVKSANKKGVDVVGYKSVSSSGAKNAKKVEVAPGLEKKASSGSSNISSITAHVIDKGDQEGWTKVQGRKKGFSPKKNPFMVLSDFTKQSRFPVNKVGAAEKASSSRPKSFQDSGEELTDIEFERYLKYMTCEEKEAKRKDRELRRINWNRKNGIPNDNFGRELHSQAKNSS